MTKTLRDAEASNPMSDQQKHTPGPWEVLKLSDSVFVERRRGTAEKCPNIFAANLRCAELNAAERVRDAAEVLLAACWAVIRSNALKAHPELEEFVGNAIAAAEE